MVSCRELSFLLFVLQKHSPLMFSLALRTFPNGTSVAWSYGQVTNVNVVMVSNNTQLQFLLTACLYVEPHAAPFRALFYAILLTTLWEQAAFKYLFHK